MVIVYFYIVFLIHCKTASSSCKKQYEIGLKIVDILINSYDFCETVRKKRKAYWQYWFHYLACFSLSVIVDFCSSLFLLLFFFIICFFIIFHFFLYNQLYKTYFLNWLIPFFYFFGLLVRRFLFSSSSGSFAFFSSGSSSSCSFFN